MWPSYIEAMNTIAFDTLKLSRKLESAGFTHEQAAGAAEALAETLGESLATKTDLRELEYRLTIRLGAMLAVSIGVVATLVKLL